MLVMYAQCLHKLHDSEGYVRVALILLIKACAAEQERLREIKSLRIMLPKKQYPDASALSGVIAQLLELVKDLKSDKKASLGHFIREAEADDTVEYDEGTDSCSLNISLWSLLPEEIKLDTILLRASAADSAALREVKFDTKDVVFKPGRNNIRLSCAVSYHASHLYRDNR